jgi:tetratricopeptide (TPR) repeat protein
MIKSIGVFILMAGPLFAAAFNGVDGYVNVPIAKQYRHNEIQFGFSNAYNGSASIQDDDNRYEIDFKSVFAINNKNQFALNLVNSNTILLHYQFTITNEFQPYQLAVGLKNINSQPFSTWNNTDYVEDVNMSPYIINTFYTNKTSFTIGYGLRAFENTTHSLTGIGTFLENFNGFFFAFEFTEKVVSLGAEYDGKDINFGLKIRPTETIEFNLGLTEQFIDGDYNPQHAMAPRRQITFGISSRNLFSHNDYFNKKIRDLNLRIADLETRELERINQQKKKKEVELISKDDILKTKVADLYSESLIKYNNRNYSQSIELLHQALTIDPLNSSILSRLGSVYYTYGFLDHAAYYWQKALEANPNAPHFSDVKAFLENRSIQDNAPNMPTIP